MDDALHGADWRYVHPVSSQQTQKDAQHDQRTFRVQRHRGEEEGPMVLITRRGMSRTGRAGFTCPAISYIKTIKLLFY